MRMILLLDQRCWHLLFLALLKFMLKVLAHLHVIFFACTCVRCQQQFLQVAYVYIRSLLCFINLSFSNFYLWRSQLCSLSLLNLPIFINHLRNHKLFYCCCVWRSNIFVFFFHLVYEMRRQIYFHTVYSLLLKIRAFSFFSSRRKYVLRTIVFRYF